jgi:transposase
MKKKDVIGIDVSKLTIDAYLKIAQAHAVFSNDTKGFRQLVKWIRKHSCATQGKA